MKYIELHDNSFFLDETHFIYDHNEINGRIDIYLKSRPHSCKCPACGQESRKLHATYTRILQDTPIHCHPTYLHTTVFKYKCLNPECRRHVFMEKLPFAKASQVRTDALNVLILGVSMFLSNEGASKVLSLLGVTISNDAIQRLYDRMEFVEDSDIEAIGVDDVAIRKGQTYATAVYDMKDHHLIALLEGREKETLKKWLKGHKKIKLIARDRAGAYAAAINEVLPECVQVADRFHLLQNLLDHLKEIFKEELPSQLFLKDGEIMETPPEKVKREKIPDKKMLEELHYDNSPPLNPDGTIKIFNNKRQERGSAIYRKRAEDRKKNSST